MKRLRDTNAGMREAAAEALGALAIHGIRIFKMPLGIYKGMHITVLSDLEDVRLGMQPP